MRRHYERLLEKELRRLWIDEMQVLIVSMGKDKFLVTDGKRHVRAKGHLIYRYTKKLPNKCGAEKLWYALKPLFYIDKKHIKNNVPTPVNNNQERVLTTA